MQGLGCRGGCVGGLVSGAGCMVQGLGCRVGCRVGGGVDLIDEAVVFEFEVAVALEVAGALVLAPPDLRYLSAPA